MSDATSLADLIRGGDRDALAGFRDAHIENVRGYCREACGTDSAEGAAQAALADFVARIRAGGVQDAELEEVLRQATRSAAAGRFTIPIENAWTADRRQPADQGICSAMPELLAARANGELRGSGQELGAHEASCSICAATAQRMRAAESAFARAGRWLPTE